MAFLQNSDAAGGWIYHYVARGFKKKLSRKIFLLSQRYILQLFTCVRLL